MTKEPMYRISQSDYNALVAHLQQIQNILGRAVIVDETEHQVVASGDNKADVAEQLNVSRMQELFGANYKGILLYNFESQLWNRSEYQGAKPDLADCSNADSVRKSWPDKSMDLVALATMTINDANFKGWCEPVQKPVFSQKGNSVVATFVCRDKVTGKILPLPTNWIGVSGFAQGAIGAPEKCYTTMNLISVNGSILLKEMMRLYPKSK